MWRMHTAFDWDFERVQFSDDNYAIVGRALAYAQKFEGDCRALNSLFVVRSAVETGALSLDDDKSFGDFVTRVHELPLGQHIRQAMEFLELPLGMISAFNLAREARNQIAHELCLGAQFGFETGEGRAHLVEEVSRAVRRIAEAHLVVLLIMAVQNKEDRPRADYLRGYCDRVVEWACWTEDL